MTETASDVGAVVQAVEIGAPAARVFELWTDPEQLARWWPDAAVFEPRVSGAVRLEFGPGDVRGEVTRYDPPNALGFTWTASNAPGVTTRVDVAITALGEDRCRVEVVHSGWEVAPELRDMHEHGWAHFLPLLAACAERRPFEKGPMQPN